jgi:hypothetical protein
MTVVAHGHGFRRSTAGSVATLQHNAHAQTYCMNQPWLTTIDWPVSAVLVAPAK